MTEERPASAPVRMTFCYPGCDHSACRTYDRAGEGKCWQLWHPAIGSKGPYCQQEADHEGLHQGGGMTWAHASAAEPDKAARFLAAYRRIPNAFHEITLLDDGSVAMTLRGFEDAVRFNNIGPVPDD